LRGVTIGTLLHLRVDADPTDAVKKAGIWVDDFWVSKALVEKRYANPGETPGVNLSIGVVA
jgi:Holliday junction resolvase RusA-like endonuclease